MKKTLTTLLCATILLAACTPETVIAAKTASAPPPAETTAASAPASTASTAHGLWIDVRTAEEFADSHLTDAVNIPNDRLAAEIVRIAPDKNTPINLYCRSGRRAEEGLRILTELGYTQVSNRGGYEDLIHQGLR